MGCKVYQTVEWKIAYEIPSLNWASDPRDRQGPLDDGEHCQSHSIHSVLPTDLQRSPSTKSAKMQADNYSEEIDHDLNPPIAMRQAVDAGYEEHTILPHVGRCDSSLVFEIAVARHPRPGR